MSILLLCLISMKKNELVTSCCIDYDYQGNGIVKVDGFVVFVKGLIVGEEATIKIIKVLKNSAIGIIVEITKVSSHRVEPICPSYRLCGGCYLMHMDYEEQLRFKKNYVQSCFKQNKMDINVNDVMVSENTYHYRNKVQIPLQYDPQKGWQYGFYRNHSHDLVSFDTCYIQDDFANHYIHSFIELLNTSQLTEGIRHVVLKMMGDQIMVIIVITMELPLDVQEAIIALSHHYNITSTLLNHHNGNGNAVLSYENTLLDGSESIQAHCLGLNYLISANSFYQVNTVMMQRLYQCAYDYMQVKKDETILDLYCGTGTIGLGIARQAYQLIGVDVVESSIENAKANALLNGIDNAQFFCLDAGVASIQLLQQGYRFDGIFVDPPRKGCDDVTIDALKQFSPKRIVYISCNPATLARDCAKLSSHYCVTSVTPVDMFANNFHIETVVLLSKLDN